MKNKNGFTLVELLAVIAVLAIVIAIAAGGVMQANRRSREKLILEMQENLKTSALIYVMGNIHLEKCSTEFSKEMENGNTIHLNSNLNCITKVSASTLKEKGLFEDSRNSCKNAEVIIYRFNDDLNSEYRAYVSDNTCRN